MMTADPFGQNVEPTMLDCNDLSCDVCHLGQRPDESRQAWVARLAARVSAARLMGLRPGRPSLDVSTPLPMVVDCWRCSEPRYRGERCMFCRANQPGRVSA